MNKILLAIIFISSVFLGACTKQVASPPSQIPESIPQADYREQVEAEQVESSGNPEADLEAIEKDVSDLDADTDFAPFSETDLSSL